MNSLLVPILVAATVALLAFGGVNVATLLLDPERRKLKNRLVTGETAKDFAGTRKSVSNKVEVDAVTAVLLKWSFFKGVNARLVHGFPDTKLSRFLLVAAALGLIGFVLAFAMTGAVLIAIATGVIGCVLPFIVLNGKRARRQRQLTDQLPEALDFLSRILKAGHSFSTGLQMMGEELPKPIGAEFRKAYDQHTVGHTVEAALKDMATRVESNDFAFFVTAVLIQRQTGGDLSEILKNISGMIRSRVRLQQHVKAKTAEGRLTGYVLVAFPLVMFLLLAFTNPKYGHALTATDTGHKLLAVSFSLQMLGLWSIRKITTIKV
jgi:tight adherence protein B